MLNSQKKPSISPEIIIDVRAYSDHVEIKLKVYADALENSGFDGLIIASGGLEFRFRDDLSYPYYANAYFKEFVCLPDRPNSFIFIVPGKNPVLYLQVHDDFWHSEPNELDPGIVQTFQVCEYSGSLSIPSIGKLAYIGPETNKISKSLSNDIQFNPDSLLSHIDFYRALKTDHEKECLRLANKKAAHAHEVAKKCFEEGCSEYEINMAYAASISCLPTELPYDNIIALNEHAAVLHHWQISREPPEEFRSFLIDAGANHLGYAADISRTYAGANADPDFVALIEAVETLQQTIVQAGKQGRSYAAVHLLTHELIAKVLCDFDFIKVSQSESIALGLTSAFFPHGVGHLLGVQVHDKGGYMTGPEGNIIKPSEMHPFLRMTRDIEVGMCFTIEPGIYFIPRLLDAWRGKNVLNEKMIDKMIPYGGIRIEDNILVHKNRIENLTRDAFLKN